MIGNTEHATLNGRKHVMQVELVDLDRLVEYENNAKQHPAEQVEQIARSIQEFGNCDPIGVWTHPETGDLVIVEGHGRYKALRLLGLTEAPVIRLDHLTDEQRRAYTVAHNQLTMNTGWNLDILDAELANITIDMEQFGLLDTPDISDLFVDVESEDRQENDISASPIECPNCGHTFEA